VFLRLCLALDGEASGIRKDPDGHEPSGAPTPPAYVGFVISHIEGVAMSDENKSLISFNTDSGEVRFSVDFEQETLLATQKQIAELFGVSVAAISKHISNILLEGELERDSVISILETTASDGKTYKVEHYNLDMIISVGYRVNSSKATKFRTWATKTLKEHITQGFTIDDNRFASGQLGAFQRLVERVREIRTSERHFYQKITDIFATSADYNGASETARDFFAKIQNKFHYAIHGHTAAELIHERVSAEKINMGLTSFPGKRITFTDAKTAKNYLSELEIKQLELLSEQFLSFAELRYYDKKHMAMQDWERKLDEFLDFNEKDILTGKGKVSHQVMLMKIEAELNQYKSRPLRH